MSNEERLNQELEAYRKLAQENKKIDVASLMINALQKERENHLSPKEKRWAYLVSIGLPPFGLIFALNYYLSDKDDAREAMWICIALTVLSIFLFFLLGKVLLSGSGVNLQQIQQIKPQDIQQFTQ